MASAELQDASSGKLVSLEGDGKAISTQLRLLPPSSKILVIPSLVEDVPIPSSKELFNPRSFIRDVHKCFAKRIENARSFLQASTGSQPRLVFMNGGSLTARSTCISQICENYTDGSIHEAEAIFEEIVTGGVAKLMKIEEPIVQEAPEDISISEEGRKRLTSISFQEDCTAKAMRDADLLDLETADFQSSDLVFTPLDSRPSTLLRPEELRLKHDSMYGALKVKMDFFANPPKDDIVTTVLTVPARKFVQEKHGLSYSPQGRPATAPANISNAACCPAVEEELENRHDHLPLPGHDHEFSGPATPNLIEVGEACLIDVQSPAKADTIIRKTKSLEYLKPDSCVIMDTSLQQKSLKSAKSARHLSARPDLGERAASSPLYLQLPRTTFVKASQTTIKKSQSVSRLSASTLSRIMYNYVDHATDAEDMTREATLTKEGDGFEPVFPVLEDLVILFASNTPNNILESIFSINKNSSYPKTPKTPKQPAFPSYDCLPSPTSSINSSEGFSGVACSTTDSDNMKHNSSDEFDPYCCNVMPWSAQQEPPTPSITPPSSMNGTEKYVHFLPSDLDSVISIQNELRVLFNQYFPPAQGYSQHNFPVADNAERLWKPVFSNDTYASEKEESTVDHILALGYENGVSKDFFELISGQVERLGMKRDGMNRSGKLDIRYLIANALQASSSTSNEKVTPLTSPRLLATLLVPHLESYLATNSSTRLLILLYPPEYLSTMFWLRKLLGTDIFKTAAILDSLASDPPSHRASPLPSRTTSKPSFSQRHPPRTDSLPSPCSEPKTKVSFSKVNYALPSTATDAEIATFLSSILASLMEESSHYIPEPEPKPIIVERIVEKIVEAPPTPTTPPTPLRLARIMGEGRERHYADSMMSSKTGTSSSLKKANGVADGKGNFWAGVDDSDDDDFDRMVMGRAGVGPPDPGAKGHSKKKALKWLGLS